MYGQVPIDCLSLETVFMYLYCKNNYCPIPLRDKVDIFTKAWWWSPVNFWFLSFLNSFLLWDILKATNFSVETTSADERMNSELYCSSLRTHPLPCLMASTHTWRKLVGSQHELAWSHCKCRIRVVSHPNGEPDRFLICFKVLQSREWAIKNETERLNANMAKKIHSIT